MRGGWTRRWTALLLALLLPAAVTAEDFRMPGQAVFTAPEIARLREAGSLARSPWLDAGLSLMEEGNPFLVRYNIIAGGKATSILPFGVPYLYGGRAANHVFSRTPDYAVEKAWISSPAYYVAGTSYLYGFDCVGYVRWVWEQTTEMEWPGCDALLRDGERHVLDTDSLMPDWEDLARILRPGDILVLRHPDNHTALYLGTLRQFGYTEEDVPELAPYLDYPLVMHAAVNAAVARRFDWLIHNGLPKYRGSQPPDGGVCAAILGVPVQAAPGHVVEQNQDTWYFSLPDGTWLTVLPWENVMAYCWWRAEGAD